MIELAAVECLKKNPIDFQWGKVSSRFLRCFYRILFILACNEDMHGSLDVIAFQPDRTTDYGVSCPWVFKNRRHHFFSVVIDPIIFKLAGTEDMHNILDEF